MMEIKELLEVSLAYYLVRRKSLAYYLENFPCNFVPEA
jgi:hypothetical protein